MNAQLDMHNKITATQLHRMVRLQLDTLAKRPELASVLPPLMVWGAPGLGKSTILRDAAREAGIGFIRFRPGLLFNQEGENLERGWPTPRAWERVSRMLEVMAAEDEELVRHMVYGLVGNRAGVEFMEFRKMSATMDDVLAMMRDPSAEIKIPQKADMKYALCSAAAYHVWRGEDAQDAARRLDGFYRICMALSSDFASMLMMDAMTGTGLISTDEACERLFAHKSYKEWSEKHGKALHKRYAL